MLVPLVGLEALVVPFVVFPVDFHGGEEAVGAEGREDLVDVGMVPRGVTICFEGSVAFVGPGGGRLVR